MYRLGTEERGVTLALRTDPTNDAATLALSVNNVPIVSAPFLANIHQHIVLVLPQLEKAVIYVDGTPYTSELRVDFAAPSLASCTEQFQYQCVRPTIFGAAGRDQLSEVVC